MIKRRTVMATGLAMAGVASSAGIARAQSGKPMMVFVGHEL
ncbi:MAG: hypothetical protein U1E23_11455 [Reyranellaceae bacterium]